MNIITVTTDRCGALRGTLVNINDHGVTPDVVQRQFDSDEPWLNTRSRRRALLPWTSVIEIDFGDTPPCSG